MTWSIEITSPLEQAYDVEFEDKAVAVDVVLTVI